MFIKHRLKEARRMKRYSQQFVADSIGISRVAYSNIERGKSNPSGETVVKLVQFFRMPVLWLFPLS